ncbi:MAG TPA: D-2-hydroxyacid dehydrogenase [Longimicrobiaceae bacterium]|nr:D-2-hydroxyacid dehydrogenase [Longimicrobiaceae bacterium]
MRRLVLDLRERRPLWTLPDWAAEEIRAAVPPEWETVEVRAAADGQGDGGGPSPEALEAVRGAEVYLGYGIPRELFRAATAPPEGRLRWVHSGAAGVGGSLHPEMRGSGVVLTNSAGIHAEPIADSVLAMALHFARGLDFAVRAQAERRWWKEPFERADAPVREVEELTVGLLGLGGIGRAVARRFSALGSRVLATRRRGGDAPEGVELLGGDDAFGRLLERSDVLVVAVPETPETRGMVGGAELARLPRGAVLVNVARGRVVDEEALAEALRAGRLRGAALDVFAREPLPPESPLWGLSNMLLTPHVSGTSHRFWRRETDLIVENLRRYVAGEPLLNTVDKTAGY